MNKCLILISHGKFCHELKASTEMIMGSQDSIYTVGLEPSEDAESFKNKLLKVINSINDDYVILADLMGGTPCNVASRLLMEGYQFELYAGMNMPMVIGFLNGLLLNEETDIKGFAIENIHRVNDLLEANSDDDDDEM